MTLFMPGVYSQAGNENWGIRGVPVSGFDDQGPATLNGAVSVYVDGALTLSPTTLWSEEQVEVFLGPQSTTLGRNSLAGAVVVQTRNPTFQPSFSAQTNGGNYVEKGAAVAGGGSIVDDRIAGRIALDYQDGDGYIDNVQAFDNLLQYTVSAKVDYRLDDQWSLTSLTTNTNSDYSNRLDFDRNAVDNDVILRKQDGNLFGQELRLNYNSDTVKSFIGAYYGHNTNHFHDRLLSAGALAATVKGDTTIENKALFGEVNWTFAPRWLRYDL